MILLTLGGPSSKINVWSIIKLVITNWAYFFIAIMVGALVESYMCYFKYKYL